MRLGKSKQGQEAEEHALNRINRKQKETREMETRERQNRDGIGESQRGTNITKLGESKLE